MRAPDIQRVGRVWEPLLATLPPWAWAALLALPFRLPLLLRPEPGRDEAAYYYWSRHFELAYAPLLQLLLGLATLLPIPELVALRLPSVLGGTLVLALFDRWMVVNAASLEVRWTGLLAVALCPWQVFSGSVLHPDGFFVAALLLFVLAASSGRPLATALAAVTAVWAKPTGFLLVPLAAWFMFKAGRPKLALALLLAGVAPVAAAWDLGMLREILAFGTRAGDGDTLGRLFGFAVLTVLLGGVAIPAAGVLGLRSLIRGSSHAAGPRRVALMTAALFLVVFGVAALTRGQFKANWVLPALLLLWPFAAPLSRRQIRWGLASAAACSAVLVLAVCRPEEVAMPAETGAASYEAGFLGQGLFERELSDWKSIEPLAREIERKLLTSPSGELLRPARIVSTDYGLAMQLAYRWRESGAEVEVPGNGLFQNRRRDSRGRSVGPTLVLATTAGSDYAAPSGVIAADPRSGEMLHVTFLAHQAIPAAPPSVAPTSRPPAGLHAPFDSLLTAYRVDFGIRYSSWNASRANVTALSRYVDALEAQRPSDWAEDDALAYWINLYNAATLELVLANYPVKSIKNIGAIFRSPWKINVVKVEGKEYTLDNIEHDLIRKQFQDPRIHFALNCASVGCPPLAPAAYRGDSLEVQLERAARVALNHPRWAEITPESIRLTKLFDWYRGDFEKNRGSVREFVARYRPADREVLLDEERKIQYLEYDWSLNQVR